MAIYSLVKTSLIKEFTSQVKKHDKTPFFLACVHLEDESKTRLTFYLPGIHLHRSILMDLLNSHRVHSLHKPFNFQEVKHVNNHTTQIPFRRDYKWGEEGLITGGIYNRTKKSISKQAKQQLIKILLEFTLVFRLHNVVKNLIHFKTNQRGTYIQGGGGVITGCIFCLLVDGPKLAGLISGGWGTYKRMFRVS